jgi:beta-xylosidase
VHAKTPVYPNYFADPFVWVADGSYYAIGTSCIDDPEGTPKNGGDIFPLLKSEDLVNWQRIGNALVRPESALGDTFWAPEVAFADGTFYLYYSVGFEDKQHQLRVASSTSPQGPYVDCGVTLVDPRQCPFAIDAHPFQDDDGQWYLFYARDFLDCENECRPGTALVVDKLVTMTKLAGEEKTVLRARCDWQLFMANRPMYGSSYDWHTLEGPFVRKFNGRYYCFYSGGRWENETYGVDYGVADNVMGPYSDAGNDAGPRVLRTVRNAIIGPGHNSIVKSADGTTDYIVYHAWDNEHTARRMFIDELKWSELTGPTIDLACV